MWWLDHIEILIVHTLKEFSFQIQFEVRIYRLVSSNKCCDIKMFILRSSKYVFNDVYVQNRTLNEKSRQLQLHT
jgi:hypothetical protein